MNTLKILFLSISLLLASDEQTTDKLYGKWQVVKVETIQGTLIPTKDFFLTISEGRLGFNRDINRCSAQPIITATTIDYDRALCTRACCDGRRDPIGGMDIYRGNYNVSEDSLIIENSQVKTYLIKVKVER